MSGFEAKSLAILGRQPALGLAELECVYGAEHVKPNGGAALLDIDASEINFKRLGGTIKVARILTPLPTNSWEEIEKYLVEKVPEHLKHVPEGKFTLGLSVYGFDVPPHVINKTALLVKKAAQRSMRIVPNKSPVLNSAQVLHNKLTSRGAWELLIVKNGPESILAQTMFVQDIEAYGARDQARPMRDARVGMLPPKLAQIMINLAVGAPEIRSPEVTLGRYMILDPFCGSGVVLQEALLMGYRAVGSDNDERMVDFSNQNLKWLYEKHPSLESTFYVESGDATNHQWQMFSAVVSEVYLGRALSSLPKPDKLTQIVNDVNTIIKKFLLNLAPQLRQSNKVCLALPAWRTGKNTFKRLPVVDHLTDMGYNIKKLKHVSPEQLMYFRENQIVARQLIVLEKK